MNVQEGKRFRRSFYGYNKAAVDAEFGRLIAQTDTLIGERENMQNQISALNEDKNYLSREQARLNASLSTSTTQIVELESNLARAKGENDSLARAVEAHKAENSALQIRCEQLRERDRDFAMREREFAELQGSVSSIMSVTKRAADRLFQKAVDNQEQVTQIAGDAAREVAAIRADMNRVREQLNEALDMVQDRIDRVDASLTGAVHKLVAIKHDDGLQIGDQRPNILDEVEHLLNLRAGENDGAYTVPALGPYGAKMVADTAQRVNDGRITPKASPWEGVEVKKVMPGSFSSSEDSILEANKLLERGGVSAAEYYDANPQFVPQPIEHEEDEFDVVAQEDFLNNEGEQDFAQDNWNDAQPEESAAIPMPAPAQFSQPGRIGFTAGFDEENGGFEGEYFPEENQQGDFFAPDNGYSGNDYYPAYPTEQANPVPNNGPFFNRSSNGTRAAGSMYVGDSTRGTVSSYGSYSFQPYEDLPVIEEPAAAQVVRPAMRKGRMTKKVTVRPVVRRR
ncbi:MAG: hypothetical protein E7554_08720 [Ruminococcaceae bacterium]|nr:hypothetical protein [Oscillospiraceae bacterium]